jgi:hypothetical protein
VPPAAVHIHLYKQLANAEIHSMVSNGTKHEKGLFHSFVINKFGKFYFKTGYTHISEDVQKVVK